MAIAPLENVLDAEKEFALFSQYGAWLATKEAEKYAPSAFPDPSVLLERAELGKPPVETDAFWGLRDILRMAEKARASITVAGAEENWPALLNLAAASPEPASFLAALNRCVSDDGSLRDNASPELYRLRSELRSMHQNCLRKVKDYADKFNITPYLQDDYVTLSSDRYVLPLKTNFKGRLRGVIHDWSRTGETCYFEPMFLVEINNRVREIKHEEREEERRILNYLGGLLLAELPEVKAAIAVLGELDLLSAKIRMAEALNARAITFTPEDEGIELNGARHPLLVMEKTAKPLDIALRPGERVLIITGGNAGGKTVCLKTLGLLTAMAMSGLPIPVESGSRLVWFERLDALIGDEQSLSENVSTFTAQIERLTDSWEAFNNRGLVLLDEFGSGTDPAEGAALAQAVLDGLLEKRCFALTATHFPALKTYALTREGARAASMLFDSRTGAPLYKVAYDQVGESRALAVAEAYGLPKSILDRARRYLLQDGEDSSKILTRLNSLALEREKEIRELAEERKKGERELQDKKDKLEREKARVSAELRERAGEITRAWKEGKVGAKRTLKEMSGLRESLGLEPISPASVLPPVDDFRIGQTAIHAAFNKRGVITDVDEKRRRARLDMDGVSAWADMKDLRRGGEEPKARNRVSVKSSEGAALSVDVRGMRADEAMAATERFLDKALLSGFSEVEIVHGRGTGALRRQIGEFLRSFPAAASVSLAPEDRGGDGVTIVRLD